MEPVKLKLNIIDKINKTEKSVIFDTESTLKLGQIREKYQAENPGTRIQDCIEKPLK